MNNTKLKNTTKGQVATEFFIYAGVFLILVIATATVIQFTQESEVGRLEYNVAKENGQLFSNAIQVTLRGGQNFTYILEYQKLVLSKPYDVDFSKSNAGLLFMTWYGPRGNFTYAYNIFPATYDIKTCNSQKSDLLISNQGINQLKMTNEDGTIKISQTC